MTSAAVKPEFFGSPLSEQDPEIHQAIQDELGRQRDEIELIASENIVSRAVLQAQGIGDDQQVCRRVSRPQILRRLSAC